MSQRVVAIVYVPQNRTPNREHVSDSQLSRIRRCLQRADWKAEIVQYHPSEVRERLKTLRPNLVFNLAYGYCDILEDLFEDQPATARRLERLGYPMTGAPCTAQQLAQDKRACARALRSAGLEVPDEINPKQLRETDGIAVWKPQFGACHRGVHIVRAGNDLDKLRDVPGEPYLLQQYIPGREYTVALLQLMGRWRALAPVRICFKGRPRPSLMTWGRFKWSYRHEVSSHRLLAPVAIRAAKTIGLCHYARIDVRLTWEGKVYVLDVNSLPNLHPQVSLLPKAARHGGISYEELILTIARAALKKP